MTFEEILLLIFIGVISGLILKVVSSSSAKEMLGKIPGKRSDSSQKGKVIFISAGGTCRDPMAAAITKYILNKTGKDKAQPSVHARALGPVSRQEVSFAARMAIKKIFGEDLLNKFQPKQLSAEDIKTADLLLVMEKSLLNRKTLPANKTYIIKEFFGKVGDVEDPWPDGKDEVTLERYIKTANELKSVIEPGIKKITDAII